MLIEASGEQQKEIDEISMLFAEFSEKLRKSEKYPMGSIIFGAISFCTMVSALHCADKHKIHEFVEVFKHNLEIHRDLLLKTKGEKS